MTVRDEAFDCLEEFFQRVFSLSESDAMTSLADLDLSFSQARMLFCVMHEGVAMPIGEIAKAVGLSTASAGRNVDHLVKLGLVERHESPDDRRIKLVSLTEAGLEFADRHLEVKRSALRSLLSRLPESDCRGLIEALRPILAGISQRPTTQEIPV